jgi:hypothetical protein
MVDGQIDCDATITQGGCPWSNANPPETGRAYGMFGAPCWYRGKWGEFLLQQYLGDSEWSFYGDNEDKTLMSARRCVELADVIGDLLVDVTDREDRDSLSYAEWYLRWAAETCNGLVCWY